MRVVFAGTPEVAVPALDALDLSPIFLDRGIAKLDLTVGLTVSEVEEQLVIAARHLIAHAAALEAAGGAGLETSR